MEGYELTDRGKIVLTVILVVLLFFLPAAIFIFSAMGEAPDKPPDELGAQTSGTMPTATPPPAISESPPPNGGGFGQPEKSPQNGNGNPEGHGSTEAHGPVMPQESAQGRVNKAAGTLSFLFFPEGQGSLGDGASSMLDEFLGSPKNTPNSIVGVETPRLPFEVSREFTAIMVEALNLRGVEEQRIAYITTPDVPLEDGSFEVNMMYISRRPK